MKNSLGSYQTGYVIGIRYRANFSISDLFGSIIDEILYTKKTPFNEEIFPLLQHTKADEKVLINPDNNNRLTINTSNIVLDINDISSLSEEKAIDAYQKLIINGIMRKYSITQINRIGYIKRYLITEEDLAKSFIYSTIGNKLDGVNDINLQFSKRIVLPEALVKKDVYDFNNVIYNIIKKTDKQELFVSVDFQRLYEPFLEGCSLINLPQFIEQVKTYNNNNVVEWLDSNYGEKK